MSFRVLTYLVFVLIAAAKVLPAGAAEDGRRVALVIGNGAYAHSPVLPNPANDARAMADLLERIGFDVVNAGPDGPGLTDLDLDGMRRALALFGRQARGAEIAAIFYAGHGLEVGGVNYLLPTDARLVDELDLPLEAIDLDTMMRFASVASTRLVLLDACRDNPLAARMTVSQGTRSSKGGLAQIDQVETGSLLGYATSPGAVASDGAGEHSPYTAALLAHLGARGVSITDAMTRVNAAVQDATGGLQIPWMNSSLREVIQLAGPLPEPEPEPEPASDAAARATTAPDTAPVESPAPGAPAQGDTDLLDWRLATQMNTPEAFRAYIATHCPGGHGCALARASAASLEAAAVAGQNILTAERNAGRRQPTQFDIAALTPPQAATPQQAAPWAQQPGATPPNAQLPNALPQQADADAIAYQDGLRRFERKDVQRRLKLMGFDPRGVDGAFGRNTSAAIAAWQQARGYRATGVLGAEQHARLLSESQAAHEAWSASASRQRARQSPSGQQTYMRATAPADDAAPAEEPRSGGTLVDKFVNGLIGVIEDREPPKD